MDKTDLNKKAEAIKFANGFNTSPSYMLEKLEEWGIVDNWWYRGDSEYSVVIGGFSQIMSIYTIDKIFKLKLTGSKTKQPSK